MRVAIFVTHPIQYYAPLFRELAKAIDLHVFYGQIATSQQQANAGFGVPFDWDVDLMSGYSSSFLNNVASEISVETFAGCDVPTIERTLFTGKFDAVIVFGWYQKFFLQAIYAAKRLGIPVFVRGDSQLSTPRSPAKRMGKNILYPFLLRTFDAVFYVGQKSREYYQYYSYPSNRMFFSPHCIDTEFFRERAGLSAGNALRSELGIDADTHLCLFAGKLVEFKRPADVVRAVSRLNSEGVNVELMMAGAGPLESSLRELAVNEKITLHMLGFCNQSRMPSVYSAADVLCLPSTGQETWGLVCNEALACGTQIIVSSDVGCAADLALDGLVGRTHSVGSINDLSKRIKESIESPAQLEATLALSNLYSISAAVDGILHGIDHIV